MTERRADERARDERVRRAYRGYEDGKLSRREFLRYASVMGASLAALGLGACGAPEVASTPTTPAAPAATATLPPAMPTTVPTATSGIKRGGKLVASLSYSTERFNDPAIINSIFVANTLYQVCDWLVRVGPDLVVRPGLATEWTPSEDGKVWTLKLREGVKFNHGKAFNADDVVFTFDRLLNPEIASAFSSVANYLKQGSVAKVDDYTVTFTCERVVADFPYHLFDYHAAVLPADWGGDFYEQPYGTGPFTIKEHRPDELIVFERRDDYWENGADGQPLPYLDSVEIRSYPDDAAWLDALSKGELQLSGLGLATLPKVQEMPDVVPEVYQTSSHWNGVLRCTSKPFDDVKVRQAFKMALDRDAYVSSVLQGYGVVAADQPLASIYELAPTMPAPKYDPEGAKALLAEAGYPDGVELKMQFPADEGHTDLATWMQASAEAAGFRLTLEPNPKYYETWLADWGDFVMGADNWATRATPSEFFNIAYRSGGDWNETKWSNAKFDELLEASDAELDPVKRKQQYQEMSELLAQDGGVVIPAYYQSLYSRAKSVQNFTIHPLAVVWYGDVWLDTSV